MAFKDLEIRPLPHILASSCPRVPHVAKLQPWLAPCALNQQGHSHFEACALSVVYSAQNFLSQDPQISGFCLLHGPIIQLSLLLGILLIYYDSIVNHLSGLAFSDHVMQRPFPSLHSAFLTTLPCCTVFTVPFTVCLSSCFCTVALCQYVKLQSRALTYLLHCTIHSILRCSLCRMSDGMNELQHS